MRAELTAPKAVRIGQRRKRRGMLVAGATVLLLCVAMVASYGWVSARGYNLNPYKPAWLLLMDTGSSRHAVVDAALTEFLTRISNDKLSASSAAHLVDQALDIQADLNARWTADWGDVIENLHRVGVLSDAQWQRYAEQAFTLELSIRPRVWQSEAVPIELKPVNPRIGSTDLRIEYKVKSYALNDRRFEPDDYSRRGRSWSTIWGGGYTGSHPTCFSLDSHLSPRLRMLPSLPLFERRRLRELELESVEPGAYTLHIKLLCYG